MHSDDSGRVAPFAPKLALAGDAVVLDSWMGRGLRGSDGPDKVGLGTVRRPVIGLALGGGAARGFAHIGIIKTLLAHGIVPSVVVGTSIGGVVGGAYATGHIDKL